MTREEANQILNSIKDGSTYPETRTLLCLYITGDRNPHAPVRSEGVGHEVSQEDWRGGVSTSQGLVGASQGGYRKKTGQGGIGLPVKANEGREA